MLQTTTSFAIMTYLDQHEPGVSSNFEQASMLIVEDNPDHWTLMRLALERVMPDTNVVWRSKPDDVLTYLTDCINQQKELPKLIVMDIYLPRRENGLDLLQQLKQPGSPYSHVPIIAFSASTWSKDISDAYERGVNAYTIKSPDYRQWMGYFTALRDYWWQMVALPKLN